MRKMNYTKTAEALHITQPAVTQHIRFLEEQYGCRLFSYTGKVLQLTEKGKLDFTILEGFFNKEKYKKLIDFAKQIEI